MAANFVLMTDDSCDLPYDYYEQNDIALLKLCFTIEGVTYHGGDITHKQFYDMLREGKLSKTSAVNTEDARALMEPYLKDGKDVLYLAFSSGLSATAQSGIAAANELSEQYPERKVICVDSLCASLGQGLYVHLANRMRQNGDTIDEVAQWAKDIRLNVAHLVMADDLMHLHRGGRVSKASAIAGGLLGIKPIIHMNNEGKLISIGKVRGKKQALTNLVERLQDSVGEWKNDCFMICHADCEEDAKFVADLVVERFGIKDYLINYIGPVIGSHTGPGTVALFMLADHR